MDTTVVAQLLLQAEEEGAGLVTLRALAEEASALGAAQALAQLGLNDGKARDDLHELRELLGAWRDAKRSAVRGAIGWVIRALLALLVLGLAVRFGFADRLAG
jgi:hypothetical protein